MRKIIGFLSENIINEKAMRLSKLMLEDDDSWDWLSKEINIQSLEKSQVESLLTFISESTKRNIKRKTIIADFFH